ncbi:hypothetical protein ABRP57_09730 [Pectobacterium aroidearum]|uniref:hypothetical protein n=1 Tax=Pectobacterium aroidearum TaxID=1201031 RepID=UPI0032EDCDFA
MSTWQSIIFFTIIIFLMACFLLRRKDTKVSRDVLKLKQNHERILRKIFEYKGRPVENVPKDIFDLIKLANDIQDEIKKIDGSHDCQYIDAPMIEKGIENDIPRWNDYNTTIPVSVTVSVKYKNYNGENSDRIIDVKKYNYEAEEFWGFCHIRQQNRTFRISRVTEAIDIKTGERISGLKRFLRKHRVKL